MHLRYNNKINEDSLLRARHAGTVSKDDKWVILYDG